MLYQGKMRLIAFSAIAAANGIASASPIIGGLVTVHANWQYNYLGLSILFGVLFVMLLTQNKLKTPSRPLKIDLLDLVLIVLSLSLFTYGLVQISTWGAFKPINAPFTLMGLSPSPFFILTRIVLIWLFSIWEHYRENKQKAVILPSVFTENKASKAGFCMNGIVFFIMGGISFLLVTFLQVVAGFDPITTGLILLVFAVGMIIFSLGTPLIAPNASPRFICRLGIILQVLSFLAIGVGLERNGINFVLFIGLLASGAGIGLLSSQANNIVSNAVPADMAEISSGIQGATRNIGNALGVAIIGLVLVMSLTTSAKQSVAKSDLISSTVKQQVMLVKNVPFISNQQLSTVLSKAKLSPQNQTDLLNINLRSRLVATRITLMITSLLLLLCLFTTNGLPGRKKPQLDKNQQNT